MTWKNSPLTPGLMSLALPGEILSSTTKIGRRRAIKTVSSSSKKFQIKRLDNSSPHYSPSTLLLRFWQLWFEQLQKTGLPTRNIPTKNRMHEKVWRSSTRFICCKSKVILSKLKFCVQGSQHKSSRVWLCGKTKSRAPGVLSHLPLWEVPQSTPIQEEKQTKKHRPNPRNGVCLHMTPLGAQILFVLILHETGLAPRKRQGGFAHLNAWAQNSIKTPPPHTKTCNVLLMSEHFRSSALT